ncbi:MAG: hypothetical protein E6Q29_14395 [Alicycliphilus sp.]|jgi:hypothetical protein|nr:MAG: hypothetical protein E6Q29_14395 [Alicycliphilus sp.]
MTLQDFAGLPKPITRTLECVFEDDFFGPLARAQIHILDYKDGATQHLFSGHLAIGSAPLQRIDGRLTGIQFVHQETRGAPKKTGRDVALFLAFMWFMGVSRDRGLDVKQAKSEALQLVMELWGERGFKGATEETHLRKRIKVGERRLYGSSLLRYEVDSKTPDGVLIAGPQSVFDIRRHEWMGVDGVCWFWRYGDENAVWGHVRAGVPLTKS